MIAFTIVLGNYWYANYNLSYLKYCFQLHYTTRYGLHGWKVRESCESVSESQ
jgi:hypothetical protein